MRFSKRCRCLACDAVKSDAPFGASFENAFSYRRLCEECGDSAGYYDSLERWVDTDIWWRPWTWFSGHWEKVALPSDAGGQA